MRALFMYIYIYIYIHGGVDMDGSYALDFSLDL